MASRLAQHAHMARMQDVETAIGKADTQPLGLPFAQDMRRRRMAEHAAAAGIDAHRMFQFREGTDRGTKLRHHDPGGQIGQPHRLGHRATGGQRQRQRGDDRIARAGDVEHLLRGGHRHRNRPLARDQHHALLAAGRDDRTDVEPRQQRPARGLHLGISAGGQASDLGQFRGIGRDVIGPGIAGIVAALGIYHAKAPRPPEPW